MNKMFGLLMLAFVVCPTVFGSSTVCSSEQLYSSSVRYDYGIPPRPGMKTGKAIILYKGQVLFNQEFVEGTHSIPPYQLDLVGEAKTLEQLGNMAGGSRVFKQTAVLIKVAKSEEIGREQVVCRQTWAMVP